ncbi:DedA family protein [Nesterenkonia alba]|uniref:DedA family protein n=1 Tax=Nesterenkonia alba TaxID=515814 RepID=UPI001FE14F7C|nr:VTT domain-containing protein [Nesterenkonia alba]
MNELLELLQEWGLWYLPLQALLVALTAFVPPFPSEIMVIASGALAADGRLPLSAVIAVTTLGCFTGDVALYATFRYQLLRVLYRWRWGRRMHRLVLRTAIRVGQANTLVGLLLIRWVPGGRAASMATAGMMRITWGRALSVAIPGAVIWSLWLVGLGYITGTTTGAPPLVSTLIGIGVGTLVGLAIAVFYTRRRRASAQVRLEASSADE